MNNIEKLKELLPMNEQNINRLKYLKNSKSKPRIAVFGKYNHGKSTLLNALVGEEIFKAADKRETLVNKEFEQEQVIWVDTPGLDADVHGGDDKAAMKGAFEVADYLFLVHQAQAGELDKYEIKVFQQLAHQDKNYSSKMFLILTQIDQKTLEDVITVEQKIRQQLSGYFDLQKLKIISVSAQRYHRGVTENEPAFCEKSGMKTLFSLTDTLIKYIDERRIKEVKRLKSKILVDLNAEKEGLDKELQGLRHNENNEVNKLKKDVKKLSEVLV